MNWISAGLVFFLLSVASAKEYPIFDGRHYNGLYYPRIQVIEWDEPEYLVFNIYSKDKPIDVSGEVIERGTNKIFQFQYDLNHRGEKVCRSVVAPPSWKAGQRLKFFIDKKDPEMDQIYVSAQSLSFAPYKTPEFTNCKKSEKKPAVASTVEKPEDMPFWYDDNPVRVNNYDLFSDPAPAQ